MPATIELSAKHILLLKTYGLVPNTVAADLGCGVRHAKRLIVAAGGVQKHKKGPYRWSDAHAAQQV